MTIPATRLKLLIMLGAGTVLQADGTGDCAPFPDETRDKLTGYFRRLAKVPQGTAISLTGSALEGETCYRKLEFSIGGQSRVVLFLSPDQRFLSAKLFDSHIDPADAEAAEAARTSAEINSYLAGHKSPRLGKEDAPITIAIFSDFQCPFCKKAMQILTNEILPSSTDRVRIVYLHYPLPSRPWARLAAESTACLQSSDAFWRLHDFVFAQQSDFNPSNFAAKTLDFLSLSSAPPTAHRV